MLPERAALRRRITPANQELPHPTPPAETVRPNEGNASSPPARTRQTDWLLRVQPLGEAPAFVRPEMLTRAEAEGWPYVPLCDESGAMLSIKAGRVFLQLSQIHWSPTQWVRAVKRGVIAPPRPEVTIEEASQDFNSESHLVPAPLPQTEAPDKRLGLEVTYDDSTLSPENPKPGYKRRR